MANEFNEYKKRLQLNKKNAQIELDNANRMAQANSKAYLQSLGLQGSGSGLSNLNKINQTYANNLKDLEMDYSNSLENYRQSYNANKKAEMQNAIADMDYDQAQNYITRYQQKNDEGIYDSTFTDLQDNLNINLDTNARRLKDSLAQAYNTARNENNNLKANEIGKQYNELQGALNSNNKNSIWNAYKNAYNYQMGANVDNYKEQTNDNTDTLQTNIDVADNDTNSIINTITNKLGRNINAIKEGQNNYNKINSLVNKALNGKIEDGELIDMNDGAGTAVFRWNAKNKNWEYIGKSRSNAKKKYGRSVRGIDAIVDRK